jgi:hypothetical protein
MQVRISITMISQSLSRKGNNNKNSLMTHHQVKTRNTQIINFLHIFPNLKSQKINFLDNKAQKIGRNLIHLKIKRSVAVAVDLRWAFLI